MINRPSRPPLRLLLVADGRSIPNWLFRSLAALEESGAATVVLAAQAARERGRKLRNLIFSLYTRLDRYLFRSAPDALAPISLDVALPACRLVDLQQVLAGLFEGERVDVVLDPFSLTPDARLAARSTYGVWSVAFGDSRDPRTQASPGFWEVVEETPGTEARLCVKSQARGTARALYSSVAPTDRRSPARIQNHVYWKTSAALTRNLQSLWEDPDGCVARLKAAAPLERGDGPSAAPGNVEMLRAGARLVRRYASDTWMRAFYREQWVLAYQHGSCDRPVMEAFRTLIPPPDRYWADPFPVRVGGDYYIFHEEVPRSTDKGSIVVSVVDQAGRTAGPIPVLERDYHVSYPFVFQWDGEFFMIPQTASHQVELYHCARFPAEWKLERVLLPGLTASDPTPAFMHGRWWLFANVPAYGATWHHDELHLFHAESPLGPWTSHRNNPVKSDVRSARPAGRVFENHGEFLRPAQDCSKRYGYAVSINRILRLDPETYEEVEVDKIMPDWAPNVLGVHTFNRAGDLTVIDCLVRSRRRYATLL